MSLNTLFYPKSVALIGASKDEGSVGYEIAQNLKSQGYKGKLYFVNPKGGKLFGKRVLEDTSLIKKPIDLSIIAIPAAYVLPEVKKLASLKTKSIVVISAGFKESGNKNAEIELEKICSENDISLIGPNCLGFINPQIKLNASFAPIMPAFGSIAFISQSGALCASVLDYSAKEKIGFSKFISVGNKAQIGEVDLLEYFYNDPKTKVIAIYMEQLEEVDLIKKIAQKITKGNLSKPIIALKSGKTAEGKKAAMSHTGALGGSDDAYNALFSQTGIIRAENIQELFSMIEIFQRNKRLKSNKIAIVTNAGGPGVLAADALIAKGLNLAQITEITQSRLKKILPNAASIKNPIDILGDADAKRYEETLKVVLEDENTGAVEVILTPQSMTEVELTAKAIVRQKKKSPKPIIATFMGQDLVESGVEILNKNKITTTLFPEDSSSAFASLNFFSKWNKIKLSKTVRYKNVNRKLVKKIFDSQKNTKKPLPITEVFKILKSYGFPMPPIWLVQNKNQAAALSKELKGALALKIASTDINHKTDIGGVVLNIEATKLPNEFEKLVSRVHKKRPNAKIDGVIVMPQIEEGIELILGVKTDKNLGKQILIGLGGIYAEVLKDTSWGIAPLNREDINRMVSHLKVSKILSGTRGHEPFAIRNVYECLGRLSQLVTDFPQIEEIDINPLVVLTEGKGAVVVDARIAIKESV